MYNATAITALARRTWYVATLGCAVSLAACSDTSNTDKVNATRASADSAPHVVAATKSVVTGVIADATLPASKPSSASSFVNAISGTLEPHERALLRAELAGVVKTLTVKVGEPVRAGAVIAVLDVPAVRAAMAAADAQLRAQEVALRQANCEHERVTQLLAAGGVSRAEMDDWDARRQAAEAAVESARAQRASAVADVARLTVRAPFDGILERRTATQGSMVQAGDELVSIIDTRTLELEASIAFNSAQTVQPGTRVSLRVAGGGADVVSARVVRVAPALDPVTRQRRVTILVPNRDGRIPAGAWAEGMVTTNGGVR